MVRFDVPWLENPNYCHDWRWSGALLEDMIHKRGWHEALEYITRFVALAWDTMPHLNYVGEEAVPEAIARAALQMYEEGQDA